jgi:hypothetical protein
MRRIARRLDRHCPAIIDAGEASLAFKGVEDGIDVRGEASVEGHVGVNLSGKARP